jgi:hypothetical protein
MHALAISPLIEMHWKAILEILGAAKGEISTFLLDFRGENAGRQQWTGFVLDTQGSVPYSPDLQKGVLPPMRYPFILSVHTIQGRYP